MALLLLASCLGGTAGCASALEQAKVAEGEGDLDRATALYEQAMADPEVSGDAKRALFELSMKRGKAALEVDPGAAEVQYRRAVELRPDDPNARLGLSRSLLRQDRGAEAEQVLASESGCGQCEKLRVLLVLERAQIALDGGDFETAKAAYSEALRLSGGKDAIAALGIADVWSRGKNQSAALESLSAAAGLIADDEPAAAKRFAVIRSRIAVEAATGGNVALADRALAVDARGVGEDAYFAAQLEVARAELGNGELDDPVARLAKLVPDALDPKAAIANPYAGMAPSRRTEIVDLLVDLYSSRAALHLREGRLGPAENDLTYALRLQPDDATVQLQRVLVISGFGKLDLAFHKLQAIPRDTPGHDEVEAILLAMRVEEQLAAGKVDAATETMVQAQGRGDLPEVHVAFAHLLAETPMDGIPADGGAKLRTGGLVSYPGDHVHRYGEALAELSWARRQIDSYGVRFPYRGPRTEERLGALETKIRAFYSLEVQATDSPNGVLIFRHAQPRPVSARLRGPGGLDERLDVPSGPEGLAREMPATGLIEVEVGGKRLSVVAEPYTQIVVPL